MPAASAGSADRVRDLMGARERGGRVEHPAVAIADGRPVEHPQVAQPLALDPHGELPPLADAEVHRRVRRDHVVDLQIVGGRLRAKHFACEKRKQRQRRRPHHRMPLPHVRSIAGTVRLLYIALAAALAVAGHATAARADDVCTTADGTLCTDDGDPCTTDLCSGGVCIHQAVPDRVTCDPVLDAYRRTLGLGALVSELQGLLATATLSDDARAAGAAALAVVAGDLGAASDALAGRLAIPPPASGETLGAVRARVAWGLVSASPPLVRTAFRAFAAGDPDLARRTRFLYRSMNQLKRELRRLQRVSGVFAR
jgi:hypothetical protein